MNRLIPVVALLIALGLFFGYINPTMTTTIAQTKQQIVDYENALTAAERFKEKEQQLAAERAAIPPELLIKLESLLPDGVDNVQLILDLDSLASRTGLVLSGFDTSEQQDTTQADLSTGVVLAESEPIDSLELTVTGKGTYTAFRTFLATLEESQRPLDLIDLEITTGDNGVHTYNMTFRLYWLR